MTLFRSFYRHPGLYPTEVLEEMSLDGKGRRLGGQALRRAEATAGGGDARWWAIRKMLFLDEPTTGLDPQCRRQLWEIIRQFQQTGGTVLLTTHYMDEAERLCDRLAIIDQGKIIAEGTPARTDRPTRADNT